MEPFVRGLIGDNVTVEKKWYSAYLFQAISRYGMANGRVYFVRPDRYVAARWHNPTAEDIWNALAIA